MPKLREFLIELGKKAGLEGNKEFDLALSASALNDLDFPDEFAGKFKGLMSESDAREWAKTDLTTKNYWVDKYTSGYNETIVEMVKEFGLSQEQISEIKKAENSGDKVKLALKGLKALEEKARAEGRNGKGEEFVKQVTELQEQIKTMQAETEKKVSETASQYRDRMKKLAIKAKLGFNWNENFSPEIRDVVYETALNAELSKKGAKAIFDEELNDFRVVQIADETLPVVDAGKKLEINDFHTLALQNHKLLKEAPAGGNAGNPSGTFEPPPAGGNGQPAKGTMGTNYVSRTLSGFDKPLTPLN